MVSKRMYDLGNVRSCIRDLFEYGLQQAAIVGAENVFDFSIGNPSIPTPQAVSDAIARIVREQDPVATHSYTSAPGDMRHREAIAAQLATRYGTKLSGRNLFLTCGAAPALTAVFGALTLSADSEFVALAPFFPDYRVFVESAGAKMPVSKADLDTFQIDFDALEKILNPNTQGVIVNTPNNPSGAIYTRETLTRLCALLREKSAAFGHPIYIICDEPYRELVYGDMEVPYLPAMYDNTIVCYSYRKSLSLPGQRIGYVLIPDSVDDFDSIFKAVAGAARANGHICAPNLMQQVAAECGHLPPALAAYEKNRALLYNGMTDIGYRCVRPDGAFYLFVEAPGGMSAQAFSELCKTRNVLVVPGDDFACPSHVRLSYCVAYEKIEGALPLLRELFAEAQG